jgi:hypothetical protein
LRVVGPLEGDLSWTAKDQSQDEVQSSHNQGQKNHHLGQVLPAVATADFAMQPPLGQPLTSTSVGVPLDVSGANLLSDPTAQHWPSTSGVPDVGGFGVFKGPPDELTSILQTFTDQDFAEMDRVISWDDFNFEEMPSHFDADTTCAGE